MVKFTSQTHAQLLKKNVCESIVLTYDSRKLQWEPSSENNKTNNWRIQRWKQQQKCILIMKTFGKIFNGCAGIKWKILKNLHLIASVKKKQKHHYKRVSISLEKKNIILMIKHGGGGSEMNWWSFADSAAYWPPIYSLDVMKKQK